MSFKKKIKLVLVFFCLLSSVNFARADNLSDAFRKKSDDNLKQTGTSIGFNTGKTVDNVFQRVVSVVLTLVGVIFITLMIYGGYVWMMARGNEEDVTKAQKIIRMAIIGLAVIIMAYIITDYFQSKVTSSIKSQTLK